MLLVRFNGSDEVAFIYKKGKYWNVTSERRKDVKEGLRTHPDYCVTATAKSVRVAWRSFTIKMRTKVLS